MEYTQQNGSKIKYQYDPPGNLKSLYLQQDGTYRKAVNMTYDALGRRLTETEYRTYSWNANIEPIDYNAADTTVRFWDQSALWTFVTIYLAADGDSVTFVGAKPNGISGN